MKRNLMVLLALLVCGAAWMVYAAQDTSIDEREVRNPKTLKVWLEANAADAEARLAAGGSVADTLALINAADAGTAQVTLQADRADDAGDKYGIVASDGAGLLIQSDKDTKGTLATKLTVGNTGIVTMKGSATLDNTTSATELNITETTVKVTGNFAATGNAAITGTLGAGASTLASVGVTGAGTVGTTLDVTGAATVGGTLGVTGNTTLTGTLDVTGAATLASTLDVDSITVDAGYGIDAQSSGTLMIGAATANKVEISIAGIETEIQGSLDVHQTAALVGVATFTAMPVFNGGLDVNEDIDIDFDAADEEIVITTSVNPDVAAGAGMVTLYDSEDANGANSAYMLRISRKNDGGANNEFILCQDNSTGAAGNGDAMFKVDSGGDVTCAGDLTVEGNDIDSAAGAMTVGKAAATSLALGAADIDITVLGPLNVLEATGKGIDTTGAGALYLGEAVATSVVLGASDANTTVAGDLTVSGGDITATGNAAKIWLGTNGYFQVSSGALQFVGHNGFTNALDADITQ